MTLTANTTRGVSKVGDTRCPCQLFTLLYRTLMLFLHYLCPCNIVIIVSFAVYHFRTRVGKMVMKQNKPCMRHIVGRSPPVKDTKDSRYKIKIQNNYLYSFILQTIRLCIELF